MIDSTTPAKLSAAAAQASTSGKPVAVNALTSQTSTTTANPDGSFTTSTTTVPTRMTRNGAWIPVDTSLKLQADGSLAPAAVPTPVAFSGGGSQPMVTQTSGSTRYSASWPGTLPKPTITGDTATYAEVLPGVDLKLTATVTGVRQVLVVKTKAAAANPALAALNFPVQVTGGTVSTGLDGSLTVLDASGTPVLHGGAPTMWDSSGSAAEAAAAPDQAPSGARSALMGLKAPAKASATTVTVTPDASLLANPAAVFPLILDPDTSFTHLAAYDTVWDVAPNSNYLNNGSSLRSGHVWDSTNARYQTNRSFLNFDGLGVISGKIVRSASLLLFDSYSASCSGTAVSLWATNAISTSTTWNNQPSWAYKMDDQTFAHGYTSSCPGAQISMNPVQQVTNAANGGWPNITMGLRADNESDAASWKIFESVKAGYAPDLVVTWTSPAVAPQITSVAFGNTTVPCGGWAGKVSDLNASPLLVHANVYGDGQGNTGGQDYLKVWANVTDNRNDSALTQTQNVYTTGIGNAVAWTSPGFNQSWLQADSNTVTVTVSATNLVGQTATSAACTFQVDTVTPGTPALSSVDFPVEDWGNTTTQGGAFNITPGGNSGHVVKYHIVADGNANSFWDQGTTNGAASSFALNCSGCAYNPFTTPGLHWLTAQAVSVAGNLSNLSGRYYFFVSPNTPQADAATALTNSSVNTTVTTTTQTVNDANGSYNQILLWGAPNGAGMWLNDTPTDSGNYAVEAVMTKATDYGKVQASVTQLDGSGTPIAGTTQTLPQTFDGIGGCCSRATFDFGGARLTKGTAYRFTFTAAGTSSTVSPYYNIGIYQLRLIPLHISYTGSSDPNANLAAGFNNIGITNGGTVGNGDFDGSGNSLDATGLANAGYGPGQKISIDGVPFTMPTAAAGTADDMVASGQTIGMGNTTGSAIGLLGSLSYTPRGGTGQITYNGTCNGATTQAYTITPVPDWGDTSPSAADRAAVSGLPWNNANAGWGARPNSLYSIIIPLNCQNVPVASIDLPAVSPSVANAASSLKIFSLGMRPPTKSSAYVASWAASLDTTVAVPAGTLRMPAHVSIGGSTVRIRLDNPYATAPVTISAASIGLQSTGAGTTGTPTALTFGGAGSVTIPPGGQVYSDAATLTVPSGATVLVSLNLPSAVTAAAHAATRATVWTATGNATGTGAATGFTSTTTGWALLDDLEVTPAAGQYQLGTLAVLGDQIGNGDQTPVDANTRIGDYIAKALPGVAGVANVSSSGNRLLSDQTLGSGGPSALTRLDRDVCDLPNLNTVVVEEGDNDLHAGQNDVAIEGNATGGLLGIGQILQRCGATPLIVPVTPFDTATTWNATGEPGYWNGIRAWTTAGNLPGAIIADGGATSVLSDSTDARKLAAGNDNGDHAMPNDAGMQLLANTITAASPWKTVPAGASDWFTLTADGTDAINSTYNGVPTATVKFIANDRGSRAAARFNGTDSTINVPDPSGLTTNAPLDTTQSFTVSAWVNLASSTDTGTESLVAQNGTNEFGYELAFQRSSQQWRFGMQGTDGATGNDWEALGPVMNGSEYGSWHHLVGVYDATAQKISLYVDGTLAASNTFHATVNFAQNMTIGGGALWQGTPTDYLNGDISDVVLYPSALSGTQVQNLYTATLPQ